jgi:CRISPR-associated protein Csb2
MLAVGVELLGGRYVATSYNDRDEAEWPPHPARLFSALVATWADGEPSTPDGEAELEALQWLEQQRPPDVVASATRDIAVRSVVPVFVPVNDVGVIAIPDSDRLRAAEAAAADSTDAKTRAKAEKEVTKLKAKLGADTAKATAAPAKPSAADLVAANQLFPDRRLRQPRTFPSVAPPIPRFAFVWRNTAGADAHIPAFTRLAARLVRLGHSSSLVHVRLLDEADLAGLEASTTAYTTDPVDGTMVLRWVTQGQCDRLIDAFARHREVEPRVLPAAFLRYREGAFVERTAPPSSTFGEDWIVFARTHGPRLPSTATAGVSRQFRRALMSFADEPIAELISGHHVDGSASDSSHLAIVPLPFVASERADGSLLGVALVIPRDAPAPARAALRRGIEAYEATGAAEGGDAPIIQLHLGSAGSLGLQRVVWGEHKNWGLRPSTWSTPALHWASATPVALDQNPGDLHHPDPDRRKAAFEAAAAMVATAIARIGDLPAPTSIDVLRSCVLPGTSKPREFPRFPVNEERPQRVLVHVRIAFSVPVRGPLLIGAGRYQGLGLLRPVLHDTEVTP